MSGPGYRYLVETDGPGEARRRYDGADAADAMGAWSAAITEGVAYVTLEALRETRPRRAADSFGSSLLVPDGMVPEVTGATLLLDLADGTQATLTMPKARWSLFAEYRDLDLLQPPPPWLAHLSHGEQWWGVAFHPLEALPGPSRAEFRMTHYYKPGGPRARLVLPEEGGGDD